MRHTNLIAIAANCTTCTTGCDCQKGTPGCGHYGCWGTGPATRHEVEEKAWTTLQGIVGRALHGQAPIVFPVRVEQGESFLIVDARGREIAQAGNDYDAGVLVDAFNRAHLAVA
jgi:hypothetical protein